MKSQIQSTEKWFAVARASSKAMRFKCRHETREAAEAEALRLADQVPELRAAAYYVVECIGIAKTPKVVKVSVNG